MTSALEDLLRHWSTFHDLKSVSSLASWDQEVVMPAGGGSGRAAVMGTLAGLRHQALLAPELTDAIESVETSAAPDSVEAAHARLARFQVDRARNVPEALARELAVATAEAHESWKAARAASDTKLFARDLERLVNLTRELATHLPGEGSAYERLMQAYEPGVRERDLVPLFDELEQALVPWIHAVGGSGREIDESPALGHFDEAAQRAFAREVSEAMGFDYTRGRLDRAAHPFCSGFGPGDVRLTWRHLDDDFRSALYGVIHEAGHGLYEQGLPDDWSRTPLGNAVSLGVHESQSRLWENHVGRSRGFWEWAMPMFRRHFPDHPQADVDAMVRALNTIKPSLIRVEADEGTYDLHIAIRFSLERRLFAGELEVSDLAEAWDASYERLLGVRPSNAAEGVLQDIHWSSAAFGYFPTYTLGNLMAAQLFGAAEEELGALEPAFARGEFQPLLTWLRREVHSSGSRYPADVLIERATGAPLGTEAYLERRRRNLHEVYGL